MDRVRFGRALGAGAREAAKALIQAADAAAAPAPGAKPTAVSGAPHVPDQRIESPTGASPRNTIRNNTKVTAAGVMRGTRLFGEAVWGPFAKLSGVLWLELTGVFFGLFAFSFGIAVWRLRAGFHGALDQQRHAWLLLAATLLFGYFAASSFLRARSRGAR